MDLAHYLETGHTDVWWFKAKDEIVKSLLDVDKILDIGANVAENFYEFKETIVLDKDINALKAVKNIKRVNADTSQIPFKKNSIDNILISDVLEHIKEDNTVVSELHRVLKRGGKCVISVPAFGFLFNQHDELLGHHRRYTKKDVKTLLKDFKITRITYWNFFLSIPSIVLKLFKKAIRRRTLDAKERHPVLDALFLRLLRLENYLISQGINLPFGLTLIIIAEKQ